MAFATLTAQLKLNIANFSANLTEASRKMSDFARTADRDYGRATAALKSHNLGLKDTARIVQGIMVSQAFYGVAQSIANATSALWEFNTALDYMQVTYTALFGSADLATDFMSALKEHSVDTIFDYQGLANASKKLLAYGIDYKNLMFIMEGLTNLGAMSGDAAALDRIALALGQIYSKGKLSAEEMRQLANAYIPITEILQSKFGLTGDDLKNVSDLNLPASQVINAIVDYANENFGSVGDAAMYTITGLQNKIVDSLKVMGTEMLKPVTSAYKSFLAYIANGIEAMRGAFTTGGMGGVFEYLVPDENTQMVIRQFIANVKNLFMSLVSIGTVAGQVFGNFASVFVTAFNIVSPIIIGFVNVLTALLNAMLQNRAGATLLRVALIAAAGAFVVLKVQAAAALVVTAVTKAVVGLSKALLLLASIIAKHPILSLLAALAVTLVGVSTASRGANKAISGVFDTLSGATGGTSSDEILQRVEQDLQNGANAADQFNNRLSGATDAAKDLEKATDKAGKASDKAGKAAEKAAKKTSGLLSFDEVFKLPEPTDPSASSSKGTGTGSGIDTGAFDDLAGLMDGLGSIGGLGDALIPDIPDFSDFIGDFTDSLFGGLETGIMDKLATTGIGALLGAGLGAIIGGLLGGAPGAILGAKIGAFAGGFVGFFWESIKNSFSNTGIGAITGAIAMVADKFLIATHTLFSTSLISAFKNGGIKAAFNVIGSAFKEAGAKSILKGGLIGAAIGLVVDGIAHLLWNVLEEKFEGANAETAKVGQTIGSVLGAVIGTIFGGPAGTLIGSSIGTFVGGFIGLFWEKIKEGFSQLLDIGKYIISGVCEGIGKAVGDVLAPIGKFFKALWEGFCKLFGINSPAKAMIPIGKYIILGILGGMTNTFSEILSWVASAGKELFSALEAWWSDITDNFSEWLQSGLKSFQDWYSSTSEALRDWKQETLEGFRAWRKDTVDTITNWYTDTSAKLANWASTTRSDFQTWRRNTASNFSEWKSSVLNTITSWSTEVISKVSVWATNTSQSFGNWSTNVRQSITDWKNNMIRVIAEFASTAITKINKWLSDTWKNMRNWFTDTKQDVATWWKNMFNTSSWRSGWSSVKQWFSNLWNDIRGWFRSLKTSVSNWWDDLWDDKKVSVNTSVSGSRNGVSLGGHATGGIFNREHVARFAEGNKAEAVIPLENASAMQPFVDAISGGIVSSLAPIVANVNAGSSNQLPPMYVGTLVADERGLRELYKRFEVIQVQENARRGLTPAEVF